MGLLNLAEIKAIKIFSFYLIEESKLRPLGPFPFQVPSAQRFFHLY